LSVREGDLLWTPSSERVRASALTSFLQANGLDPADVQAAWQWSVADLNRFWDALWEFGRVIGDRGAGPALASPEMPGATWYPSARLNYAENALDRAWRHHAVALIAVREDGRRVTLRIGELRNAVAAAAAGLRRLGVTRGDRVAAVLPNAEHAVIAFLATASLGAVWSSCSPDFGATGMLDRFQQISPKVLLGVDGYRYNGRAYQTLQALENLRAQLPSLTATVVVPYLAAPQPGLDGVLGWDELLAEPADLRYERVPFDAPLWILFSSGTTGRPKPIVQGHGGIVLEHIKQLVLHTDLTPDDSFFWFTTTGWMMWNLLVGGLLVGSTVVAYDGSAGYPDLTALWRLAENTEMTVFGTSAPFIHSCMRAGITPGKVADLSRVHTIGSTGAPLSPEGFGWVYDSVKGDVAVSSVSGGTDVCTAFAAGSPISAVHAGEITTRAFGCAVAAFDANGNEVLDDVGELVVTAPMPSMPVGFWGDADGSAYRAAYFATYPGVWHHGDWCRIVSERGSVVISGRSDATLNRGGVRLGTAEFYRVVEALPEIADSLVVDVADQLLLFVVLAADAELDDALRERIRAVLRIQLSPRHVPDHISAVIDLPRTLNGKKLEVPVKRILSGQPLERAASAAAVINPQALLAFVDLARAGSVEPG
jgi:acetoacetyl-CoA synthetase